MFRLGWVVCCLCLVLLACVEQKQTLRVDNELNKLSAVAVVAPGFAMEPSATLAWRSEVLLLRSEVVAEAGAAIDSAVVKSAIENQLQLQGHRFADVDQADYLLIAAIVLGDNAKARNLKELARLYPSLENVSGTLEKGTLLIGLSRPGSPVVLWRAALQAYLAEVPNQQQSELRLQAVIASLFATLPMQQFPVKVTP